MEWLLLLPPFHRVPRDPFSLCAKKIDVAHRLLGGSDHEAEAGPKGFVFFTQFEADFE